MGGGGGVKEEGKEGEKEREREKKKKKRPKKKRKEGEGGWQGRKDGQSVLGRGEGIQWMITIDIPCSLSLAECCISLRGLFSPKPVNITKTLIHQGLEIGELE